MKNRIPPSLELGKEMLGRAIDRVPTSIALATLLAISNLLGMTARTADGPVMSSIVEAADCYDLYMGALHPLNNCNGGNPLIEELRKVRASIGES